MRAPYLAIVCDSQLNRAARAVENAAPVEIRKERGFPTRCLESFAFHISHKRLSLFFKSKNLTE